MKKIILCIALLLGFSYLLISGGKEAQASASSEIKSIKKYAAKGTVKGAKGIKLGMEAKEIQKRLGKYKYKVYQDGTSTGYRFEYTNMELETAPMRNFKSWKKQKALSNHKIDLITKFESKSYTYSQVKKVFGKATNVSTDRTTTVKYVAFNLSGNKTLVFYGGNPYKKLNNSTKMSGYFLTSR